MQRELVRDPGRPRWPKIDEDSHRPSERLMERVLTGLRNL